MNRDDARRLQDIKDYVYEQRFSSMSRKVLPADIEWLIDRIETLEKKVALVALQTEDG